MKNRQKTEKEEKWEFFFAPDSISSTNYPLGTMDSAEAEKAIKGKGSGHLYRRKSGEKAFQMWKWITDDS